MSEVRSRPMPVLYVSGDRTMALIPPQFGSVDSEVRRQFSLM